MILPNKLVKGDVIKVIAPASPANIENILKGKNMLEQFGYRVELGRSCYMKDRYLAGSDEERVKDVNEAFYDKKIKGIICARGGYGTLRILDKINYNIIKTNPKVFVGYSDITAMHIAINQKSNLVTFHGPMVASNMFNIENETLNSFVKNVCEEKQNENVSVKNLKIITSGVAEGIVTGGNLSMIISTLGTEFEIDTKGKILFIEEIGEESYRLDRMLTQLRLSGKLKAASAIVLGDFKNCGNVTKKEDEVISLFKEFFASLNKPVLYNLKSGHCKPMYTIPLGIGAKIIRDKIIFNTIK